MIEFKAECGHSVRAKDSDAGGTTTCKYCGRQVAVPSPDSDLGDDLLSSPGTPGPVTTTRVAKPPPRRGGNAPTGLIKILLGLVYAAVAAMILVFGLKMVLSAGRPSEPSPPAGQPQPVQSGPNPALPSASRVDLFAKCGALDKNQAGLVVLSIPLGAKVYISGGPDEMAAVQPHRDAELLEGETTSQPLVLRRQPGHYRIGFTLPINSPSLRKTWGDGFLAYRRGVEEGTGENADFFALDDADEKGVDASHHPMLIHRTYPITLQSQEWSVVTALFVPNLPPDELVGVLPDPYRISFNQEDVRAELLYQGVPAAKCDSVIRVLKKIGKVVWPGDEEHDRMVFQIQPNGQVWRINVR